MRKSKFIKPNEYKNNYFSLTFDVDWAPDFVIDDISKHLIEKRVKATWFITHDSDAIRRLGEHPELFEIGIHPNFFENTTQGREEKDIMSYLLNIVPHATSFRTHSLLQSTPLLKRMREEYGLLIDSSLYLPGIRDIKPHRVFYSNNELPLTRIPFLWEDDLHSYNPDKSFIFYPGDYHFEGLKVFNFHPLFIALNMFSMDGYETLKRGNKKLNKLTYKEIRPYIHKGIGDNDFFLQFVDYLTSNKSYTVKELSEKYIC